MDEFRKFAVVLHCYFKFRSVTEVLLVSYYYNNIFNEIFFRCWKVFKSYHLLSGYSIWLACLLLNQSPYQFYIITGITLGLEIIIMACGPWVFWMMDAPFKAGVTVISEYSIVLCLRLIVILIFERSLLENFIYLLAGIRNRIYVVVRLLKNEHNSNDTPQPIKQGVGRPRKH